ncbi:MAG: hypothetical protein ABFR97_10505 [Thermodesulfobacteriota bacterium]
MAQQASVTRGKVDERVDINEDAARVGIGVICSMAALIGLWGATCMASALVQYGVTGVVKGWFGAITG